jgi:hypothetical protein
VVPETLTGEKRMLTGFSCGKPMKGDRFEGLGVLGWTLLKWVFNMRKGVD